MKLSEMIDAYGNEKVEFQKLDDCMTECSKTKHVVRKLLLSHTAKFIWRSPEIRLARWFFCIMTAVVLSDAIWRVLHYWLRGVCP
jgi:hypothetical protein